MKPTTGESAQVLQKVHTFFEFNPETYNDYCGYCEVWLVDNDPHYSGCPRADVEAALKQWKGEASEDSDRNAGRGFERGS